MRTGRFLFRAQKKRPPLWGPLCFIQVFWARQASPLLCVFRGAGLTNYRDPDLAGVAQLTLDALGDVAGHELRGRVVDLVWTDQDPDLPAGLDRIRLLDALEGVGDLLQLLQALDVGVERLPARAGSGGGDGVRGDQEQRLDRMGLLVVVV